MWELLPRRNTITSSYSSTGGFPPVQRRSGRATSHARLPQTSSKTVSEEGPGSPSAASGLSQRKTQHGKDAEAIGQTQTPRNCSPMCDSCRPRKHKTPLLPHRRGSPLSLLPPPQLGFQVTMEDLDLEKEAALRTTDSALWGETEAGRNCGPTQPSCSVPMLAAGTAPLPAVPPITDPITGLPITSAVSSSPSACTSAGLAPQPASETEVTPMDTTPAPQPLRLGSVPGSSGNTFPSTQVLQMFLSDSVASVTTSLSALRFCNPTPTPKLLGLAPQPASDTVTPVDTTPAAQPLLLRSPLAPVGASSHLTRPSRCPPVTAWPQSQPGCLH
uniref:Uncharacterized protein n=1 Tax=Equus caballus TaxID=9796 RepID=A0A9L0SH49_HORSE